MNILPLPHHPQQSLTDCLPACAKTILDYYQVRIRYGQLKRLLKSADDGTPFNNLTFLTSLSVTVTVRNEFNNPMALLDAYIQRATPVILSVDTAYLPYWTEDTDHAVIVAGIDATAVAIYDPWFPKAPQIVDRIHVESAWLESTFTYGVIRRS